MTPQTKHIYIAVALISAALIAVCAYLSTAKLVARADQVKQDMAPVHEQAAQQKESAVKAEDVNQKALLATLAAIAAQKQQPVSSQVDYDRIAQMIEQRMAVHAVVKPDPTLPNAPSATMPAKELRDYMLDCDASKAGLSSCQATVDNTAKQLAAEVSDHDATKKELAATRTAMKGGSFFHRLKSNSKFLVIGIGTGAALGYAAHH
jgi:hypothetical protein